jgi:transposase
MERDIRRISPYISFMKQNISIPLGGIVMLNKVEKHYGLFNHIFQGVEGKATSFIPLVKVLTCNKLSHAVSVLQINNTYPLEFMKQLGLDEKTGDRTIYRTLERIGTYFPFMLHQYQQFIKQHQLIEKEQIIDFSSSYFEGKQAELGKRGYSRDKKPGKLQVTFGISTGISGVPTALTIQKGNVQDKTHMKSMITLVGKILPEGSLLIFDTGANTLKNKEEIQEKKYHYLTLRPKKVGPYTKYISFVNSKLKEGLATSKIVNSRHYTCVKKQEKNYVSYIYFCPELYQDQSTMKKRKFTRQKKKGDMILRKRKHPVFPSEDGWVTLLPSIQRTLTDIENPYMTGVEGFFILESSVDDDPWKILALYKKRDKAEKFFRAMKEGIELRPIRHWSTECIIGIFFISFLANLLVILTHYINKISPVKNVKLLKKQLNNLTLTIMYPENQFRFTVLSNVSPEIDALFGDFVYKWDDRSLKMRW